MISPVPPTPATCVKIATCEKIGTCPPFGGGKTDVSNKDWFWESYGLGEESMYVHLVLTIQTSLPEAKPHTDIITPKPAWGTRRGSRRNTLAMNIHDCDVEPEGEHVVEIAPLALSTEVANLVDALLLDGVGAYDKSGAQIPFEH